MPPLLNATLCTWHGMAISIFTRGAQLYSDCSLSIFSNNSPQAHHRVMQLLQAALHSLKMPLLLLLQLGCCSWQQAWHICQCSKGK